MLLFVTYVILFSLKIRVVSFSSWPISSPTSRILLNLRYSVVKFVSWYTTCGSCNMIYIYVGRWYICKFWSISIPRANLEKYNKILGCLYIYWLTSDNRLCRQSRTRKFWRFCKLSGREVMTFSDNAKVVKLKYESTY